MTAVETIIAEAAKLPLRDAAFSLWRQRPRLDTLEGPPMKPEEIRMTRISNAPVRPRAIMLPVT